MLAGVSAPSEPTFLILKAEQAFLIMASSIHKGNKPTSIDPQEAPLEGDPAFNLELPHSTTNLPVGARLSHFGDQ